MNNNYFRYRSNKDQEYVVLCPEAKHMREVYIAGLSNKFEKIEMHRNNKKELDLMVDDAKAYF